MTSPRLYWDCTDGHPFPALYDEVAHNILLANFSIAQSRHFEARRLQHSRDVGLQVLKEAWQSDYVFPVGHIGNCFRIIREKLGPIATSAIARRGMQEIFGGEIIPVSGDAQHQFMKPLGRFGYQIINHETGHRADETNIQNHADLQITDASECVGRENFATKNIAIARASAWAGPAGACFIIDPKNSLQIHPNEFPPLQLDTILFSFAVVSWEVNAPYINERFQENQKRLDELIEGLSSMPEIVIHTPRDSSLRASHLLSFSILNCDAEFAAMLYDEHGISVGSQSACLANSGQPSDVLSALQIDTAGHIRVSLPLTTSSVEVERFLDATLDILNHISKERKFLAE